MVSVADQLAAELDAAHSEPLRALLGCGPADDLSALIASRAGLLAAQLASDDPHLAADTALDIMCALWPPDASPPPMWWWTPLGVAVAAASGREVARSVTHAEAADILGVTKGTVSQLVHRGTLERHPDGGVKLGSVLERMVRLRG